MEPNEHINHAINVVGYLQHMLEEKVTFKEIALSLGMKDPRKLKRLMSKKSGVNFQVYHQYDEHNLATLLQEHLPMEENLVQWGIRHVKASLILQSLCLRVPQRKVGVALQIFSRAHYDQRRSGRRLRRLQYDVTIPMALWHIDCKNFPL